MPYPGVKVTCGSYGKSNKLVLFFYNCYCVLEKFSQGLSVVDYNLPELRLN